MKDDFERWWVTATVEDKIRLLTSVSISVGFLLLVFKSLLTPRVTP